MIEPRCFSARTSLSDPMPTAAYGRATSSLAVQAITIRAYFLAAKAALAVGRLFPHTSLITPVGAAIAYRWSSWLAGQPMRLWRNGR